MRGQISYLVVDDFGDYHCFQTLDEARNFGEKVLLSTGEDYLEIFEIKEAACVSREVSFSFHVYE